MEVIEWAIQHAFDETCPPVVPSLTAKTLWRIAHQGPKAFVEKYYPLLMKGGRDKAEEDAREDLGAEESLKIVDEWLAHCRRTRQSRDAQRDSAVPPPVLPAADGHAEQSTPRVPDTPTLPVGFPSSSQPSIQPQAPVQC
jgi:hypothetical protein